MSQQVEVPLKSGVRLLGCTERSLNGINFFSFYGIPFAQPPLGPLRFKPPVPKKWSVNTFQAVEKNKYCTQIDLLSGNVVGEEDCLVLNVFTPQIQGKLPVVVFIHGGSFSIGAGNLYGPRKFLDHEVVFVTINYRLHVLGFLSTNDDASPGNYGLLDQILALQWVQENIERFGGDANDVTAIGESAGAVSIMHLMFSSLAKGLFHKAILMSGNSVCHWSIKSDPKYWAEKIAQASGFYGSNSRELVEHLRKVSVHDLTVIQKKLSKGLTMVVTPVVDGYVLTDHPVNSLKKGLVVNRVPVLMGVTKDEFITFLPIFVFKKDPLCRKTIAATITAVTEIHDVNDTAIELVKEKYVNNIDTREEQAVHWALLKLINDALIFPGHYLSINLLIHAGIYPFIYSYDYEPDYSLAKAFGISIIKGAGHADDLYPFFDSPKIYPHHKTISNNETENQFLDIWVYFIKHGKPCHTTQFGKIEWEAATTSELPIYHLNKTIIKENMRFEEKLPLVEFWYNKVPTAAGTKKILDVINTQSIPRAKY